MTLCEPVIYIDDRVRKLRVIITFGAQLLFVIVPGCCAVFLFYSQFLTLFLYLLLYLAIYFVTLDIRRNSRAASLFSLPLRRKIPLDLTAAVCYTDGWKGADCL